MGEGCNEDCKTPPETGKVGALNVTRDSKTSLVGLDLIARR